MAGSLEMLFNSFLVITINFIKLFTTEAIFFVTTATCSLCYNATCYYIEYYSHLCVFP